MNKEQAKLIINHMFKLAYDACGGTTGMGCLQAKESVSLDDIMPKEHSFPDGKLGYNIDYGFGRMMKLYLVIEGSDDKCDIILPKRISAAYQGWAHTYPTVAALLEAAKEAAIK